MCEMRPLDKWEKRWDLDHTLAATNLFGWGFAAAHLERRMDALDGTARLGLAGGQSAGRYGAPHRAGSSKINAFSGTRIGALTQQTILANRWGEKIWQTKLIMVSQQSMKRVDALNDRIRADWLTPICWTAWKEDILPWGRKICLLHTSFFFLLAFNNESFLLCSRLAAAMMSPWPWSQASNKLQITFALQNHGEWLREKLLEGQWAVQRKPEGLLPVGWSLV